MIGEVFDIEKGVRQGGNPSPNLFTATLEEIFKRTELGETAIQIDGKLLNNLRFADDIELFANTRQELEEMIWNLDTEGLQDGMRMNLKNTNVMLNRFCNDKAPITVNGETIEYKNTSTWENYSHQTTTRREINRRESEEWKRFGQYSDFLRNRNKPNSLKIKMSTESSYLQ